MSNTDSNKRFAITRPPAVLNGLCTMESKAAFCMYLIDSAVEPSLSFLDIDVQTFAAAIEYAEQQPRSVRLVMAITLLAEVLLIVGQRQTTGVLDLPPLPSRSEEKKTAPNKV